MAKLLASDFDTLAAKLGYREHASRVIGHNTVATFADGAVVVTLHGHPIVRLFADGRVAFSLAGWPTVTTRERINHFLPRALKVRQHRGEQCVTVFHRAADGTVSTESEPIGSRGWYWSADFVDQ